MSELTVMNAWLLIGIRDSKWNCCYCNWEVHLEVVARLFKFQVNLKCKTVN
jgi:hypothetical protein